MMQAKYQKTLVSNLMLTKERRKSALQILLRIGYVTDGRIRRILQARSRVRTNRELQNVRDKQRKSRI